MLWFVSVIDNSMNNMISVVREDVPEYLRSGRLFQNLDSADEEKFEVPFECFKKDSMVTNILDLSFVLQSARFWGLDDPPVSVVSFFVRNTGTISLEDVTADFPEYRTFLTKIFQVGQQSTETIMFSSIDLCLGITVVEHLHTQEGFRLSSECFLAAAEHDDQTTIEYLTSNECPWHDKTITRIVQHGSLQCLEYALRNGHPVPEDIMNTAVLSQQVETVQFLLRKGFKPGSNNMWTALQKFDVKMMDILHQAGCVWPPYAASHCVAHNQLDCLIYVLKTHGNAENFALMATAAVNGSFQCMEYLHLHGYPWDPSTTLFAAQRGHVECLRYAHQRGCPLDPTCIEHASTRGDWPCMLYCILQGALWKEIGMSATFWIVTLCQLIANFFFTVTTYAVLYTTFLFALMYTLKVLRVLLGPKYAGYVQGLQTVVDFFSMGGMLYLYYTIVCRYRSLE